MLFTLMNYGITFLKKCAKTEKGQGMVEYGLIIALIAIVVAGALSPLGKQIVTLFGDVVTKLGGTAPAAPAT